MVWMIFIELLFWVMFLLSEDWFVEFADDVLIYVLEFLAIELFFYVLEVCSTFVDGFFLAHLVSVNLFYKWLFIFFIYSLITVDLLFLFHLPTVLSYRN